MKERALAEQLLRDHLLAARALTALLVNNLPEQVRSRVVQVVSHGSGYCELRTNVETGNTELLLVPIDGSETLWLTRTTEP